MNILIHEQTTVLKLSLNLELIKTNPQTFRAAMQG